MRRAPLAICVFIAAMALRAGADPMSGTAAMATPATAALPESTATVMEAARVAARAESVATVILVRHAEKSVGMLGEDPPLGTEGRARATALAATLAKTPLRLVYSTYFLRNRQTVQALIPPGDSIRILTGRDFAAQAARIRRESLGGTSLVVGHSDTLPQLILALAGETIEKFTGDFDRLYVVTLWPGGSSVTRLSYGVPPAP